MSSCSTVKLGAPAVCLSWIVPATLAFQILDFERILWWRIFGIWANMRRHLTPQLNLWLRHCAFRSIVPSSLAFRPSYTVVILTRSNTVLFWLCTICGSCACILVLRSLLLSMRVVTSFVWTCCFGVMHILAWSNTVLFKPCPVFVMFSNAHRDLVHLNLLLWRCAYHGLVKYCVVWTFCSKWLVVLPCAVDKNIIS